MAPDFGHGKICYLVMPARDVRESAEFYSKVFRWQTRTRGDGSTAFDDGVGQVSGTWIAGLPADEAPRIMIHIMVDDAVATLEAIRAHGGTIVQPIGADHPEITAHFRDPAGNVLGIYQHRSGK
jgi:predicted enzyme related to lactoylglutathione lyase